MACCDNSWRKNIHKHRVHDKLHQEKRKYHSIYCTCNRKEIKTMNKAALKVGYLVEDRARNLKMIMPAVTGLVCVYNNGSAYGHLADTNDDLTHCHDEDFDIMKVYGFTSISYKALDFTTSNRPLLWERKEKKKMTVAEIEKELGYEVEIISES